jgi:hypothetical protein
MVPRSLRMVLCRGRRNTCKYRSIRISRRCRVALQRAPSQRIILLRRSQALCRLRVRTGLAQVTRLRLKGAHSVK